MQSYRQESLQKDIDHIRSYVLKMSQEAERALNDCLKAYLENNRKLAYAVILRDQHIDEKEKEIDRLCLEFLVRQQPVAGPLRFVYSTIRINLEIERVGDYAESIARQVLKLSEAPPYQRDEIKNLAKLSIEMFHNSVKAFLDQDISLARKNIEVEATIDALRNQLNSEFMTLLGEQKTSYEKVAPLTTIIRKFERVSDQARNICMETLYMCTGEYCKHPGTEAFRILFVDDSNSCTSQMAEAIANSLNQRKFIFSSAGLDPKPIDQSTIDFMRTKGIDISRASPKAIHQIPNLDHYQVIIALSENAHRAFPQRPSKVVLLDWPVPDPSNIKGNIAETTGIHEEIFNFIKAQTADLISAIIGTGSES
ncbi:MAG: phosphate signaling complex protein PhoU [Fibrobacter sp.]|nr:phosphate signaling complex protein PhoU [Fibrobacter sp.]